MTCFPRAMAGLEISDARMLKALEDHNRRSRICSRKRCWMHAKEKNSDVRLAEACCDLGHPREGLLAAAFL